MQVSSIGDLGSFQLTKLYVGEFYDVDLKSVNFKNVTLKGYAGGMEVFSTAPYTESKSTVVNDFPIDYTPAQGKSIDSFRIYYTKPVGVDHRKFNLSSFTIAESSVENPVVPATSDPTEACPQPGNEGVVAPNPAALTGTGSIAITVLNDDKKTAITESVQVKMTDKNGRFVPTTSNTLSTFTSSDKLAKGTYNVTLSNGTISQTTEVKVGTKQVSVKLIWESNLQGLKDERTGAIKKSGAITGIVYDSTADTAKAVCGATVKVISKKTTWSTKTNNNGSFKLYVPVGTYDVIVEGKDSANADDKKNILYKKVKVTAGQASAPFQQLNAGLNWDEKDKVLGFNLTEASLTGTSKAFTGKAVASSTVSVYTVSGDTSKIWVTETKPKKTGEFNLKIPLLAGKQVVFVVQDEAGNQYVSEVKNVPKIDAPALSASAAKGTAVGTTKIKATKTKNTDNKILVIASTTATSTPKLGDAAPTTSDSAILFLDNYNYESTKEISVKGATFAAVYEVSVAGEIVKFKDLPLTGKIKE